MGSKPASRLSCSTTSRASSSPDHRLPGFALALSIWSYTAAKLVLNDFAVGPFVLDFTNSAFESKPDGRAAPKRFVASIAVFPSRPWTLPSASSIAPPGTAISTASASETSPPSFDPRHGMTGLLPLVGEPAAYAPADAAHCGAGSRGRGDRDRPHRAVADRRRSPRCGAFGPCADRIGA